VPWIHNVRNTDFVAAIDDAQCLAIMRLFNEPEGQTERERAGVPLTRVEQLPLPGISRICNLVAAIKMARYYEMDRRDFDRKALHNLKYFTVETCAVAAERDRRIDAFNAWVAAG
jgi:cysteine synthase A